MACTAEERFSHDAQATNVPSDSASASSIAKSPAQDPTREHDFLRGSGEALPVNEMTIEKPMSWSAARKLVHSAVLTYLTFASVFTISVYSPAIGTVAFDFRVSDTVATLPFSLAVLGMAIGSLVASPLSETVGRQPVLLGGLTGAALFTLGAGFTDTLAALTVCRFFAGVFSSAPLAICAASMADIFAPADRAVPLSICAAVAFLGPAIGPIIGGYIVATRGWRWTQWIALMFMAPCLLQVCMRESYLPAVEARRRPTSASPSEKAAPSLEAFRRIVSKTLLRPLVMLVQEPVVTAITAYVGFNFGLNWAFFAAYPYVFASTYDLSVQGTGYTFTGLAVGVILGGFGLVAINKLVYLRKLARARLHSGSEARLPPEQRLYGAMIGGPCMVVSLFWFGWTALREISLYVPVTAEALFGLGNVLVYSSCSQYLVDHYGAARGASATAANTMVRYVLGSAFPLFTTQIFKALGTGWASSLLGFISLALAVIPWMLFRFGPRLRRST